MTEDTQPDIKLGAWVYCRSHVGPHSTGWCSVDVGNKIALHAQTAQEATAEVRKHWWPIHGYCAVCYRYIINEVPSDQTVCSHHTEEERRAATQRRIDLDDYLWNRRNDG